MKSSLSSSAVQMNEELYKNVGFSFSVLSFRSNWKEPVQKKASLKSLIEEFK